jgi:hypothetical protein
MVENFASGNWYLVKLDGELNKYYKVLSARFILILRKNANKWQIACLLIESKYDLINQLLTNAI